MALPSASRMDLADIVSEGQARAGECGSLSGYEARVGTAEKRQCFGAAQKRVPGGDTAMWQRGEECPNRCEGSEGVEEGKAGFKS